MSGQDDKVSRGNPNEIFMQTIDLDGARFQGKLFSSCTLRYSGWEPPILEDCAFLRCSFEFYGRAENTLRFLHAMAHSHGGAEFIVNDLLGLEDWAVGDGKLKQTD